MQVRGGERGRRSYKYSSKLVPAGSSISARKSGPGGVSGSMMGNGVPFGAGRAKA